MARRVIAPDTIDAILFDLDGTLVDSDNAAVDRVIARLEPVSWLFRDHDTVAAARRLIMRAEAPGNAFLRLLDLLRLDEALTALNNRLTRRRRHQPADFKLIDGVTHTLQQLSHCYKLALVSNRSRRHITEFRTCQPEAAQYLDEFISRQDTVRFKPHPAPLNLAARKLGAPVGRCLMVGDTTVDIRAARRAGAWSAGVLSGFGSPDELARAGAHVVLSSATELSKLLRC